MNRSTTLAAFAAGFIIGSAVVWHCAKTKYEKIADEEIKSVKEVFARENDISPDKPIQDTKSEYENKVSDYANYTDDKNSSEVPFIISPEEFGEKTEHEVISLTYYSDGVLADDCDVVIKDVEETIGADALNHFGEYEDDSVFVRNCARKCDYEILFDSRKYSDVIKDKPYLKTEET